VSTDEYGVEVDTIEALFYCESECPEILSQQSVEEEKE